MNYCDFQAKTSFSREEFRQFVEGEIEDLPDNMAKLESGLNLWVHEVNEISFDRRNGVGKIIAAFDLTPLHPIFTVHFKEDPVVAGCFGLMGVTQCLKFFGVWLGIPGLDKFCRSKKLSFAGQIRPFNKEIRYELIVKMDNSDGSRKLVGVGKLSIDDVDDAEECVAIYSFKGITVSDRYPGNENFEIGDCPQYKILDNPPLASAISLKEFSAKNFFTNNELLARSHKALIDDAPDNFGSIPQPYMLNIHSIPLIKQNDNGGKVIAIRDLHYSEWFFDCSDKKFNAELMVDGFWQILGFFAGWQKEFGVGRALGYKKLEIFREISSKDSRIIYDIDIEAIRHTQEGNSIILGSGIVYNQDRSPVLKLSEAKVGMYFDIEYRDFPMESEQSVGGKGLKKRMLA